MAQRTTLTASDLPDNLAGLRSGIERRIPHGRTDNGGTNDRGAWGDTPAEVDGEWQNLVGALARIEDKHPKLSQAAARANRHMGTLGTGNHFVEVCLDEDDRVWVMLHSGSRGIGQEGDCRRMVDGPQPVISPATYSPAMAQS